MGPPALAENWRQFNGIHLTVSCAKRFRVLARDGFACTYCGRTPRRHGIVLEPDHINPEAHGGGDEMANLRSSCHECNIGKSDFAVDLSRESRTDVELCSLSAREKIAIKKDLREARQKEENQRIVSLYKAFHPEILGLLMKFWAPLTDAAFVEEFQNAYRLSCHYVCHGGPIFRLRHLARSAKTFSEFYFGIRLYQNFLATQ